MLSARWIFAGLVLLEAFAGCVGPPEPEDDKEESIGNAAERLGWSTTIPVGEIGDIPISFEAQRARERR
jgi:hypothetical protein